ncbi:MAG: hypothetical protein JW751_20560 [Polyangiaceae bacterium]|nr:hypothetical protein [Polyangiaceae bacterium]
MAAARRAARVLVILDNVERWDSTVQPSQLPESSRVTLLITTRRSHLGGCRFHSFPLESLCDAESRALVRKIAGESVAARPGFDDLLVHLDGHALALELAGAYLREYPEVTPAASSTEESLGAQHPLRAVVRAKLASLLFEIGEPERVRREAASRAGDGIGP